MNDKYTKKKCRNTPIQQKNDSLDLSFYFTLSFFCCFRNANNLPGKRSPAGCFCLIKPKKSRIFGVFSKRKHCTIVSFVQCSYGWSSWIRTSGMTESKSVALPLGYTPIFASNWKECNLV